MDKPAGIFRAIERSNDWPIIYF